MDQLFPAHGAFSIQIENRTLITEVRGPWNAELAQLWVAEAKPIVIKLAAQNSWTSMTIIAESMLSTPEAMAILAAATFKAVNEFHLVAHATMRSRQVCGYGVLECAFEQHYLNLCPVKFFETLEPARTWLAQMQQQ